MSDIQTDATKHITTLVTVIMYTFVSCHKVVASEAATVTNYAGAIRSLACPRNYCQRS